MEYVITNLHSALSDIEKAHFIKGRRFFRSKRDVIYIIYYGEYQNFYKGRFYGHPDRKTKFVNYIWGSQVLDIEQYHQCDFTDVIKNRSYLDSFLFNMLLHYFQHEQVGKMNTAYWEKKKGIKY